MIEKRLILMLVLYVCLSASFAYVMGPDDRIEVDGQRGTLAAVRQTGMIRIQGEGFVSGLLTGKNCDVVISAGHAAIYWQSVPRKGWHKGKLRGRDSFRFSLDPKSDADWYSMTLVKSGYEQAANVGKDGHDWSIFRLHAPALADCEVISIMRDRQDCKHGLLMPAFHFDRPETKLLDHSCQVKQRTNDGIIVHDCDSKDGSSGAPLFCRGNATWTLLAINISGLTNRDYFDAGVYGKSGQPFNDRQHKNFAIPVAGEFYRALTRELMASVKRRTSAD